MFELEATEETVEAAQQEEEEVTRINNSLVLPVSSAQTTTTRIESSVFIPVSSTGSADGVVQALVEAIKDQGIEVESFTFDPETGELSYVVKIVNYAGSGSQSLENTIEDALEQEGIDNDDVTHGTSKATTEDTAGSFAACWPRTVKKSQRGSESPRSAQPMALLPNLVQPPKNPLAC